MHDLLAGTKGLRHVSNRPGSFLKLDTRVGKEKGTEHCPFIRVAIPLGQHVWDVAVDVRKLLA